MLDLNEGTITLRAFDDPDIADGAVLQRRGQPLEVDTPVEAARLHLSDDVCVGEGKTHVSTKDAQLGLSRHVRNLSPTNLSTLN